MSKTFRSIESFDEIRKECVGLIHERENTGIGCGYAGHALALSSHVAQYLLE